MIPSSRSLMPRLAPVAVALLLSLAAVARPPLADHGLTFDGGPLSEGVFDSLSGFSVAALCDGNNHANDNYLDTVSMGGPMVAISWTPTVTSTIVRIEILTGEVSGASNRVGLWSDDGGSPAAPSAPLGYSGSFTVDMPVTWYGADLNVGVPVVAGDAYWIVWDPAGSEQASCTDDPVDIQQSYYGTNSGGVDGGAAWELGPFSFADRRWKFKVYCEDSGGDDEDGDGVLDDDDLCPGTVAPELAPTVRLGVNRWALVDDDGIFDTTPPNGVGPRVEFTVEDTRGCSCEQVIEALGIGWGHDKFGCSTGVMRRWTSLVAP